MIIYVDIDNTICNTENSDYHNSKPRQEQIDKINKLHDEGHEIVYWTARGGHSGLNWKAFTEYQLTNWECKYTRIETQKKPSYDLFICDKTKRIEEI
jgi:hydroxymethylpyrimidine pyrophosphatase-like HAD family hydrolase|tara:strand:- start:5330 stop:5620 length:291 start_codon:yes stop_codon:yes gene_type:complete